jgi:hypothetical protein
MATYNKFNNAVHNLCSAVINFNSDTFKVMLTNTAPVATNSNYSDISGNELANGNGYTTGGTASTTSSANSSGTETATAADVTFTATGSMGPFRYAVYYDSTTGHLWCWFDYGSSVTLAAGETFVVEPNSASPNGTLFTLS